MAKFDTYHTPVKIFLCCVAWYSVSSVNNVVGKIVLNEFPYPMTVSMVQLGSITLFVIPILKLQSIPQATNIPVKYWITMIIPLAAGKFFASVSAHISLWKVSVSYAHTVKATLPMFTVLLSRIVMKEKQTTQVYLSVLPIIGGVIIATATEFSFNVIGLLSALVSTFGFSLQSIFSKKCLKDTGIHQLRLLFILSSICAISFTPLWLWYDVSRIAQDTSLFTSTHAPQLLALILIDGFLSFCQNLIAFNIIAMLTPLSYAVANATKRISIISFSLVTLHNPVTATNVLGMLVAVLGVLMYNKAKYDQRQVERQLLPTQVNGGSAVIENGSLLVKENGYVSPYTLMLEEQREQKLMNNHLYFEQKAALPLSPSIPQQVATPPSGIPPGFSAVSLDTMVT